MTEKELTEELIKEIVVEINERMVRMSEGNPGAQKILDEIIVNFGLGVRSMNAILDTLEENKVTGPKIWVLAKDNCLMNIDKLMSIIISRKFPENLDG